MPRSRIRPLTCSRPSDQISEPRRSVGASSEAVNPYVLAPTCAPAQDATSHFGSAASGAACALDAVASVMAALYAVRGFAVGVTVSGGISLFGYAFMFIGLLFAAPVVLGVAMILGILDTWLDLRAHAQPLAG